MWFVDIGRGLLTHARATADDDATDGTRAHERVDDEEQTLPRQRKAFVDVIRVVHTQGRCWFFSLSPDFESVERTHRHATEED